MTYVTRFGRVEARKKIGKWSAIDRQSDVPKFPSDKGELGGSCNRSACLRPGANWYNHSTRKHYCRECAHDLNYDRFNRKDALEMWGHLLCTEVILTGEKQ